MGTVLDCGEWVRSSNPAWEPSFYVAISKDKRQGWVCVSNGKGMTAKYNSSIATTIVNYFRTMRWWKNEKKFIPKLNNILQFDWISLYYFVYCFVYRFILLLYVPSLSFVDPPSLDFKTCLLIAALFTAFPFSCFFYRFVWCFAFFRCVLTASFYCFVSPPFLLVILQAFTLTHVFWDRASFFHCYSVHWFVFLSALLTLLFYCFLLTASFSFDDPQSPDFNQCRFFILLHFTALFSFPALFTILFTALFPMPTLFTASFTALISLLHCYMLCLLLCFLWLLCLLLYVLLCFQCCSVTAFFTALFPFPALCFALFLFLFSM